jgi:hypothetical protein
MNVKTILGLLSSNTKITDAVWLRQLLRLAVDEVFDATDYEADIEVIEVPYTSNGIIALPWYINKVLGVKNYDRSERIPTQNLQAKMLAYENLKSPVACSKVGQTPLETSYEDFHQLTFSWAGAAPTSVLTVTIHGTSSAGSQHDTEEIYLPLAESTDVVSSKHWNYLIQNIELSGAGQSDLHIYIDTVKIGSVPSGYLSAPRQLLQFPCEGQYAIHYVKRIPDVLPDSYMIRQGPDRALLFKAQEYATLGRLAQDSPQVYLEKARQQHLAAVSAQHVGSVTPINWGAPQQTRMGYV